VLFQGLLFLLGAALPRLAQKSSPIVLSLGLSLCAAKALGKIVERSIHA
jgi:hypothetical protein